MAISLNARGRRDRLRGDRRTPSGGDEHEEEAEAAEAEAPAEGLRPGGEARAQRRADRRPRLRAVRARAKPGSVTWPWLTLPDRASCARGQHEDEEGETVSEGRRTSAVSAEVEAGPIRVLLLRAGPQGGRHGGDAHGQVAGASPLGLPAPYNPSCRHRTSRMISSVPPRLVEPGVPLAVSRQLLLQRSRRRGAEPERRPRRPRRRRAALRASPSSPLLTASSPRANRRSAWQVIARPSSRVAISATAWRAGGRRPMERRSLGVAASAPAAETRSRQACMPPTALSAMRSPPTGSWSDQVEAAVLLSEQVVGRDEDLVEGQLGGVGGVPAELLELAGHREPLGAALDEENEEALVAALVRGLHGGHHEVRARSVRNERLRAAHEVAAVDDPGTGADPRNVGAGPRLRDAERRDPLAADGGRQEALFLVLGTEPPHRRCGDADWAPIPAASPPDPLRPSSSRRPRRGRGRRRARPAPSDTSARGSRGPASSQTPRPGTSDRAPRPPRGAEAPSATNARTSRRKRSCCSVKGGTGAGRGAAGAPPHG